MVLPPFIPTPIRNRHRSPYPYTSAHPRDQPMLSSMFAYSFCSLQLHLEARAVNFPTN
jgi:hypothetical protein